MSLVTVYSAQAHYIYTKIPAYLHVLMKIMHLWAVILVLAANILVKIVILNQVFALHVLRVIYTITPA